MTSCAHCQQSFVVRDEDRAFLEKVSPVIADKRYQVPAPSHCPDCRQQRRLAWRNERVLYWRSCDATGKRILSVFAPDTPYVVYDNAYWWTDQWDPYEYGREYDFSRPFFEQFEELLKVVPQLARSAAGNQNCDYVNQCGWCKNCYLIFEADANEDCLYSGYIYNSKSCVDDLICFDSELCYDCVNVTKSYHLIGSLNCDNCSDSAFLKDCIGCRDCFGSVNLRNSQYVFFNEQLSKEAYQAKMDEIDLSSWSEYQAYKQRFLKHTEQFPCKSITGHQNEDSNGNYLINTQRCHQCFELRNAQDCAYVSYARNINNVQDMNVWGGHGEGVAFSYEVHEVGVGVRNTLFSDQCWEGVADVLYSKLCMNQVSNLFGCIGLRKAKYCILNQQYSQQEYEELLPKIIEHMQSTGEWGEFFPVQMSPVGYNATIAQEYYPLTKKQALAKHFRWTEYEEQPPQVEQVIDARQLPDKTTDIPDDVLNWALRCERSGKLFRMTQRELSFYRVQQLPIPRYHHEVRHQQRLALKTPRKLWQRPCDQCQRPLETSFSPERPEKVYCESCFQQTVS